MTIRGKLLNYPYILTYTEDNALQKRRNQALNTSLNTRLLRIFAVITAIGAYVIILLGVLVTATGSGNGCGNTWPFCHGQIIPGTITIAGLIEYSHRFSASIDGTLVVILVVWAWLTYRKDFRVKLYAFLSILFIVLQGALGALTVVYEGTFAFNWILSIHFGLSLIALGSVVLLMIRLFQLGRGEQSTEEKGNAGIRRLQWPVWGLAVYTYIVVYTGALVEHTGAVTGCGSDQFPTCSTYLPGFASLAGIQMIHRYATGLLCLFVLTLVIVIVRKYREYHDVVLAAWWCLILIALQAISGMLNVFTEGQMLASLLHATLISVFFSVLCYLCAQVGWPGSHRRALAAQQERTREPIQEIVVHKS